MKTRNKDFISFLRYTLSYMKIGIDGSEAFVENKTGVENYAYQIILGLSKIDLKNNYIIYLDPRVNKKPKKIDWPNNFEFKSLNCPFMWTQVGLALATYTQKLDLLFVPSHTLPLFKNPFLKSVVTVHDLGAEYLPGMHQLKQRLYLGFMTKKQLHHATKLIAVSYATKKDIQKKVGISASNIKVIYEGFNTSLKRQNSDILNYIMRGLEIEKNTYFLFVGTIQPRKNLECLILAYHQFISKFENTNKPVLSSKYQVLGRKTRNTKYVIPNTAPKLVLAGGKGWLSDEIYKLPKELGIENQVIFTGRVSDIELASLYQNAIALVYPSLFEGFGLPILEAFNFRIPVVTSNTSSMPEVAGDGAFYVDPNSTDQIAKALESIEKEMKLRDNLVKKGDIQLKKFSWEKAARETLELFEEVKNG